MVEEVEKRGPWKRWAGHPLFVYATIATWFDIDKRQRPLRVLGPRGDELGRGSFTIVMNANPYTFLGNRAFEVLPDLTLQDPLAVVTIERLRLRTLGPVVAAALRGRGVKPRRGLRLDTGLRSLTIEADPPAPYQVDGDHLGERTRFRFTWTPDHLTLLRP